MNKLDGSYALQGIIGGGLGGPTPPKNPHPHTSCVSPIGIISLRDFLIYFLIHIA
jgi:hypothetical protein